MPPEKRYKGQRERNAQLLFGAPAGARMESKEMRENVAIVMALSQEPRFRALSRLARDEHHLTWSLATLMEKLNITYHQLSEEFKSLQKSQGFIRAAQHIPDLMEQTAIDAGPHEEVCGRCEGAGKVGSKRAYKLGESSGEPREQVECEVCHGAGKIRVPGNADKLKLIFETFGLTGKGGGLALNVDLRKLDQPETHADLAEALGPILEGSIKEPSEPSEGSGGIQ